MASKGGYAAATMPRQGGGDRFYNPPARRLQQTLLEQQQLRRKELVQEEWSSDSVAEILTGLDVSSKAVALPVPRSFGQTSPVIVTNLDRVMEAVTPFVEARHSSEVSTRRRRTRDLSSAPFYYLEDLWESFSEWSAFGAGVSLFLYPKEPIEQFYVPSLSGIQLFLDKSNPSSRVAGSSAESRMMTSGNAGSSDSEGDKRGKSSLNMHRLNKQSLTDNSGESPSSYDPDNSHAVLLFEYLEHEQPYNRRPLSDKISVASEFSELSKCRSSDLHPSSWMCVAWYPIYRIPVGPTLQDLDASFLTFHLLSTQPRSNQPAQFHAPNTRKIHGIVDPTPRISLPVFALASYKLKGSILSPSKPHECQQEDSLLEAADKWLAAMPVTLPDFLFFRNHYTQRR